MAKKNKIIDLFGTTKSTETKGVKYSVLLEQFVSKFAADFREFEFVEDIFEFSINAWNLGNTKSILKGKEAEEFFSSLPTHDEYGALIHKMIEEKTKNFKAYTNFIVDYEFKEVNGEKILQVSTQDSDAYLASMEDSFDDQFSPDDFQESYINRSAITLKPLAPFLEWLNSLEGFDYKTEIETSNVYLINEDIEDIEAWLKKKFDRFFMMELEGWHLNKTSWPQGRTYKMFKQWFDISTTFMVYDMEKTPVLKDPS